MTAGTAALALDAADRRLLDGFQRDLPLVPQPFGAIAAALGLPEAAVLARLARLTETGAIARVGAVRRANAIGRSTLAAIAAASEEVERIGALLCAEPGVNHVYLRENALNFWFVATGPDRAHVDATLARIAGRAARPVIDLPLVRAYHIDLGFALDGPTEKHRARPFDAAALRPGDAALTQALCDGLPLVARPWAVVGERTGRDEGQILADVARLLDAGALTRLGVIVRHRRLGWRANAMVCFGLPEERIDEAGERLAEQPGVTLCYRRRPDPVHWPYPLFCMVHGRSRQETLEVLGAAVRAASLAGMDRRILFSTRCFRQTGALVAEPAA
jgi:DNA-binding Lrp family transcriptional regulator